MIPKNYTKEANILLWKLSQRWGWSWFLLVLNIITKILVRRKTRIKLGEALLRWFRCAELISFHQNAYSLIDALPEMNNFDPQRIKDHEINILNFEDNYWKITDQIAVLR